jgi:hypothetical protein
VKLESFPAAAITFSTCVPRGSTQKMPSFLGDFGLASRWWGDGNRDKQIDHVILKYFGQDEATTFTVL